MLVDINIIDVRTDEDGIWIARCDQLPGCHSSGETEHEAVLNFQTAAKKHLEALKDSGRPIPEAFREKFVLTA